VCAFERRRAPLKTLKSLLAPVTGKA
jgi:hypothetical protein